MRVLGVDPGLRNCGWAVIDAVPGLRAVGYGVIRNRPSVPGPDALRVIADHLDDLIAAYRPDEIAIESIFFSRNVSSAIRIGEVRGAVILTAARHGVPSASYTPQQIKRAATGKGKADKAAVQSGIAVRLGLLRPPRNEHAADAIAAALCHHDQSSR